MAVGGQSRPFACNEIDKSAWSGRVCIREEIILMSHVIFVVAQTGSGFLVLAGRMFLWLRSVWNVHTKPRPT